jgi:exoribonuclease-2
VLPGGPIDAVGRARLSTVYMPGYKLTMLPDEVVQIYTLQEGRNCPALSLYVTLDEATLEIKESVTRLEQVPIVSNLRHDVLDSTFTEAFFEAAQTSPPTGVQWGVELTFLHRLAKHLKASAKSRAASPRTSTGLITTSSWTTPRAVSRRVTRSSASARASAARRWT